MEIVATVCDNIIECDGGKDEKYCSGTNLPTLLVAIFAIYFVLIYIFLRLWRFQKVRHSKSREYFQVEEMRSVNEVFIEFERHHIDEEIVENINLDLLKIAMNSKGKENEKMLRKFFNIVAKLHDCNESTTFLYLHQNCHSILSDKIISAKYPGIVKKTLDFIENLIQKDWITKLLDKLALSTYLYAILKTVKRIVIIEFEYMDAFKDFAFATSTCIYTGGIIAIYNYPKNFASVIVMFFFVSIILPSLIASFEIAVNNPGLIFLETERKLKVLKKMIYQAANIMLWLINPILLANSSDVQEERFVEAINGNDKDQTLKILNSYHKCNLQIATYKRIDLGLEVFYQMLVQLLLLLLAKSKTPTTEGLESMFNQRTTIFGIEFSAVTLLTLSILWSLKSCIIVLVKHIQAEKVYLPTTSKIIITLWTLFGVLRRVLTMVAYFIPGMGLFSILNHHKAEQIPFKIRVEYAAENWGVSSMDKIELRGLEETVLWSDLDRWNYSDPQNPTAPHYSIYTGMIFENYMYTLLIITAIHITVLLLVKIFTARNFKNFDGMTKKFVHILENQNFSSPFLDWDNISKYGTREDYQRQFRLVFYFTHNILGLLIMFF